MHATLQSAQSDAAHKGTVARNVADVADPPSISRNGRSICVWTGDQPRCFLDAMASHELYALNLLAATTGMRRGEIAGLLWHNVDLDAARLTINQQIVSVQYQLIESGLKTPTRPPQHRPRPPNRRRTAPPPPPPTREAHGHRPPRRRRLRVRQARRLADNDTNGTVINSEVVGCAFAGISINDAPTIAVRGFGRGSHGAWSLALRKVDAGMTSTPPGLVVAGPRVRAVSDAAGYSHCNLISPRQRNGCLWPGPLAAGASLLVGGLPISVNCHWDLPSSLSGATSSSGSVGGFRCVRWACGHRGGGQGPHPASI